MPAPQPSRLSFIMRAFFLLVVASDFATAENIVCDFSMCGEHSFGRPDSDCCGSDGSTYCLSGVVKIRVLPGGGDVTWPNAPPGWYQNCRPGGGGVQGSTCCINGNIIETADTFIFVNEKRSVAPLLLCVKTTAFIRHDF